MSEEKRAVATPSRAVRWRHQSAVQAARVLNSLGRPGQGPVAREPRINAATERPQQASG